MPRVVADRFGRRTTIVAGLVLFAAACFLLAAGETFPVFAVLMGLSGLAIGVFKMGALALIGDISTSTTEHTSVMNTAEGFFGVGAIIWPAILAWLLAAGLPWTWLYAITGVISVALIVLTLLVKYPEVSMGDIAYGFWLATGCGLCRDTRGRCSANSFRRRPRRCPGRIPRVGGERTQRARSCRRGTPARPHYRAGSVSHDDFMTTFLRRGP